MVLKDDYDWEEHELLVKSALSGCGSIVNRDNRMWLEDFKQAASLEVYNQRDKPPASRVWYAKNRVTDEIRRVFGRSIKRGKKVENGKSDIIKKQVSLESEHQQTELFKEKILAVNDSNLELVEVGTVIPSDWKPQWKTVAIGLYLGKKKEDIATEMGVTPGRVSQILKDIKLELLNGDYYWMNNTLKKEDEDDRV